MKGAASSSLRALQAGRPTSSRAFSSSACQCIAAAEATAPQEFKYTRHDGESRQDTWKRNMKDVVTWRKQQESLKRALPLYIPPTATGKAPKNAPRPPLEASISTLLASGAALGHAKDQLNPAFMPYVYGSRSGLSIIDLEQTLPMLRRAAALVRDVVKGDGKVLFIGRNGKALTKAKERLGDNGYVAGKWMPGMLTNAETYFGIQPVLDKIYTPDLVFFVHPSGNLGAIRECSALNIPTVGLVDSDTDPRIVTYAIPANSSSPRTAELVIGTLSIAGQEGRRMRLAEADKRAQRAVRDREWARSQAARAARKAEGQ